MDARPRRAPGLPPFLDGPLPRVPAAIDRVAEGWAAATPRLRLTVALATALLFVGAAGSGAARSPWGPDVAVVVALTARPAGTTLTVDDLVAVTWPALLAPVDGFGDPSELVGSVLAVGVVAGLPIVHGHLGDGGLAEGLAPGRAAFPLVGNATGTPVPPGVRAGQLVDVIGNDPERGGAVLATSARVLAVDGATVWLDVARDEAAALGAAAAWGALTLVLLPA